MMKTLKLIKLMGLFLAVPGLVFISSCSSDGDGPSEPDPTETILEIVQGSTDFDSLAKYVAIYPEITAALSASGDVTVFAPNDNAFISLLGVPGFPADIALIDPDIIKGVLLYHVGTTRHEAADINGDLSISTLLGEPITFTADGKVVGHGTTEEIEIVQTDIKATNGVVHIVGSVLIPPSIGAQLTPILGTNAGTLLLGAAFSDLADGIEAADEFAAGAGIATLTSILAGADFHTVFAPTNETFAAAAAEAGVTVEQFKGGFTGEQWYGIIANHVVMDDVGPAALVTGAEFTTVAQGTLLIFNNTEAIPAMNGIGIYIDSNGTVDLADQTTYTTFDGEVVIPTAGDNSNGFVHVIAGILSPTP